jgi:hypothetical protein
MEKYKIEIGIGKEKRPLSDNGYMACRELFKMGYYLYDEITDEDITDSILSRKEQRQLNPGLASCRASGVEPLPLP